MINVCVNCINNKDYKNYIKSTGKKRKCSYCSNTKKCIDIESLANEVDDDYRDKFKLTNDFLDGDTPSHLISEMLGLDNKSIADHLVSILSEREERNVNQGADAMYDADSLYTSQPNYGNFGEYMEIWEWFCSDIKHRTRFFNNEFIDKFNDLFNDLDRFKYNDISCIREININDTDATFYRARRIKNENEKQAILNHPENKLSAPPPKLAQTGRMNPRGVPVFYGAYDIKTCIAEIRASVTENIISGQFKLNKSITVLDLTILKDIEEPPCYQGDDIDKLQGAFYFLRQFSSEITKPIHSDDSELEYLPSQAFSEYLSNYYKIKIDAIIYPSTQTNNKGRNIALLSHVSQIRNGYLSLVDDSVEIHEVKGIDYDIFSCDSNGRPTIWNKTRGKAR